MLLARADEVIGAGTVEIASGGSTGSAAVTFVTSGGGTLQLDSSVSFGGTISGFGQPEYLDLRDIAFGSGTSLSFTEAGSNLSGTLTVSDGTHTANLTLLGQYVTAQFTKASDGHGGILIGDPPVDEVSGAAGNQNVLAPNGDDALLRLMMEPNERFGSGIWNQASVDKPKASVSLNDGGLASLVQAMAGHAGDRPGLDLITLAQATSDPSQQNHIGASLHSG